MLPVFTATEMRSLDARAIRELGIPGPRLMERAGAGAAQLIAREFSPVGRRRIVILCGRGNNGGDGFVAARHLRAKGARVRVFLVGRRAQVEGDAAWALSRWRGRVEELVGEQDLPVLFDALPWSNLVVDALLGTGLSGSARGLMASVIELVNGKSRGEAERRPVVALDIPSGIASDGGAIAGAAIRADVTLTFAGYKRALVVYPAASLAGRVSVVPIGIPADEVGRGITTFLLEDSDIRAHLPARGTDAHKGTFGHVLVVAGSLGKTGAAALAGRAVLRTGAGLSTVATAASQQPIVASLGMETMTEPLPETAAQSLSLKARDRIVELAARTDAVALGPGLSLDAETQALIRSLVAEVPRPMVVDADGLSALAGHLPVLARAAGPRLLTPHPGEMARMLGRSVADVQADRIEVVREFCRSHGVFLVLKGAGSVIGEPGGRIFVNSTGNPGMASGGTGDVLTGMVGALLARGIEPLPALLTAVFLHGRAGDLARDDKGEDGLIAGDVLEAIPAAFTSLRRRS